MNAPRHTLPTIVAAQFAGGSLWFVGNAVLGDLAHLWPTVEGAVGWLTSAVQLGFIVGTLAFAVFGLADRIPSHRLFFASAAAGAAFNAASLIAPASFPAFVATRVLTGICLAGIYPVGMKLAASWFREGLGAAIGFLVGALVLGTAFPHLLGTLQLDATTLILSASGLAVTGGLAILLTVPEGPAVRIAPRTRVAEAFSVFSEPDFRSAALGYFGHMWELYAFWAFVPFAVRLGLGPDAAAADVALGSFCIIAIGSIACAVGGQISVHRGSAAVAGVQLVGSGACALLSPLVFILNIPALTLGFLAVWGAVVVGDSPQFSAIAARSAPPDRVGTGLTLMNMIGFALTIPSIALLSALESHVPGPWLLMTLAIGPILGVLSLRRVLASDPTRPQ
ncbi:MAG: MFS transporter [Myxococcota bacterium]